MNDTDIRPSTDAGPAGDAAARRAPRRASPRRPPRSSAIWPTSRTGCCARSPRWKTCASGPSARSPTRALYGISAFARDILNVADNMHRALHALDEELRAKADAGIKALLDGVELTERELMNALEKHGVKRIEPLGPEVRSQPPSGDVRGRGRERAGRQRRAGGAGRLSDRRAGAAPGDGRGVQGRSEGAPSGGEPAAAASQRQSRRTE